MDNDTEFIAYESLHSCARRAGVFFANLAVEEFARGAKADTTHALIANLGTRLFTLASFLAEPAVPISEEVEDHATQVLLTLREVFIVATTQLAPRANDILGEIETRLYDWDHDREASRVMNFFQRNPNKAETLSQLCDSLRSKVSTSNKSWHTTMSLPKNFTVPEPNRYENSVNESLYRSVKMHMKCDHMDDRGCERQMSDACVDTWLPTRLRLGGPLQSANWAVFDVVTSSLKQGFWNQFRWVIPTQTTNEKKSTTAPHRVRFDIKTVENMEDDEYDHLIDDCDIESLDPGYICDILDSGETSLRSKLILVPGTGLVDCEVSETVEPLFPHTGINLLSVLQNYHTLTVKDKITLSHTVAQAFWQLYASDMMASVWTSETIWFMHEHRRDGHGDPLHEILDELPMSPYIVFDFGSNGEKFNESPNWPGLRSLPHRFPHILALGALLLDIGLGRSVGNTNYRSLQNRQHMIRAFSSITSGLKQLEDMKWEGFALHKSYFTQAIRFCATYNDQDSIHQSKSSLTSRDKSVSMTSSDISLAIMKRKKVLYENVIRPLAWLAGAFHENNKNITCSYNLPPSYLQKLQIATSEPIMADTPVPVTRFNDSGRQWLQTFRDFAALTNKLIESITKNSQQAPPPFKIALLDTGYNPNMACFRERSHVGGRTLGQISWIDFASNLPSPRPIDEDGHGSYMTQLVMNVAPLADIQVVRVTQKREGILQAKKNIADAIIRAGLKERVDIISMSFGFEGDDDSVRDIYNAITTVHQERKGRVIFLAAASNDSSHQTDMFPARHPHVISMHATNDKGDFVFNPSTPECILGTFSEAPTELLQELTTEFPDLRVNRPTSSAAAAVGAGITALMLAHISALVWAHSPVTNSHILTSDVIDQLKTGSKMQGVLHEMATASGGNRARRFLNPIRFWRNASRDAKDNKQMHLNILKDIDHFVRN